MGEGVGAAVGGLGASSGGGDAGDGGKRGAAACRTAREQTL